MDMIVVSFNPANLVDIHLAPYRSGPLLPSLIRVQTPISVISLPVNPRLCEGKIQQSLYPLLVRVRALKPHGKSTNPKIRVLFWDDIKDESTVDQSTSLSVEVADLLSFFSMI